MGKKPVAIVRLKKLAEQPFDDDNFRGVIDSLRSESDRAAVIIAGSLLDHELTVLIRKVMRPLSSGIDNGCSDLMVQPELFLVAFS